MGFRTPHRCLHAIAPMPLIYKALERFREVKQRLYFVLERSGSGSASGLQARPTRPTHCCPLLPPGTAAARVAARLPCAPQLRTRSEFALRWCAGSFGQAHIQNMNERSMCVAMQALEAGQCVELAPGMPTFSSGLAVAPLRVGGRGASPAVGPAPVRCVAPALVGVFSSRRGCQLRDGPAWGASLR